MKPLQKMRKNDRERQDKLEEGISCGVHAVGNEHRDDETVDGNDTSHDYGNDGLHDELGAHDGHGGNTSSRLGRSVSSTEGYVE
jgi:hypothetical protein